MAMVDEKSKAEFLEDVNPEYVEEGDILVDNAGGIQRLPVPSKDPNDPLNFSTWEKTGIITSCCWFCT